MIEKDEPSKNFSMTQFYSGIANHVLHRSVKGISSSQDTTNQRWEGSESGMGERKEEQLWLERNRHLPFIRHPFSSIFFLLMLSFILLFYIVGVLSSLGCFFEQHLLDAHRLERINLSSKAWVKFGFSMFMKEDIRTALR